ncbi:MAG: hypothetical protein JO166_09690 [Deltaproteobacteria bacterium]|nr:hypothetical protein [Deltaproteobacteria bacterium]
MLSTLSRRSFVQTSSAFAATWLLSSERDSAAVNLRAVHVCPKSAKPARKLYAMNLMELTTAKDDLLLTLHCLQGLANRQQPVLFLIQDPWDEQWLAWLHQRSDIDEVQRLEIGEVFDRFLPCVKRMYVTDPQIPATVNVATMLAAVTDGLVATPATMAQYYLPAGNYPDSSKDGMDLRRMHWKRDVDAYRWVYEQIGDKLSRQVIAFLDPATSGLRDYLVEFKIPILWIASPADTAQNPQAVPEEEAAFARDILMKWPPNIPCMGWPGNGEGRESGIGEWDGVRLASECAKFEICSAYDGYSPTVSNLSVHSGTTAELRQKPAAKVTLERNKVYYAFIRSDGDGLNFLRHYYRKLFDDPQHGTVPMGWHTGPCSSDCMPDILDYFYRHARPNDCFINALTGVGYIHEDNYADNYPEDQRRKILDDFVRLSGEYRARIDATVLATFAEMAPERLKSLAAIEGIKGVFANYGRTHITNDKNLLTVVDGKPVFRAVNGLSVGDLTFTPSGRRRMEEMAISEVRRNTPSQRPAFLHVFVANWLTHMEMAANIAKGLGSEYVAVRPDQLVDLYWQSPLERPKEL